MATVPLSGTNIRLLSGIPFNNDYKNSRWFTSETIQRNYFTSKPVVHSMNEANFQRIEGKHFVAVNKSTDELWGANYIMFQNAQYNNKWFYAFITKLEYKQRNNTHVHFEIDVLQTWKFEMNFKPSYVVREHRPLWNSDGTPVINTIDEGLNYGVEYDTTYSTNFVANNNHKWLVVVTKTPLHDANNNTISASVIGTPQPLNYYVTPYRDNGNSANVIIGGSSAINVANPTVFLNMLFSHSNAVNNVVSIYVTDNIGVENSFNQSTVTFPNTGDDDVTTIEFGPEIGPKSPVIYIRKAGAFHTSTTTINNKYQNLKDGITESKLLMYPYSVLVLDDFKGNRQEYKLEFVGSGNTFKLVRKGSLGLSNYNTVGIEGYNQLQTTDHKTNNESALINQTPSDVPIMNDMLSAFLQGNRNSLQTQKASIKFNGLMNAVGSGIGAVASGTKKNPIGVASSGLGAIKGVGNTIIDLQAINSKLHDINNIPPEISKMGNNTSYDYGNRYNGVFAMWKQIKPEYKRILTDFFNMFGYKTNEVKIPNFRTRQYWNYVQTESCNILGNFNNEDLVELKAVFDNGITLWHTDDIGNYALDNGVR